MKTMSEHLEKIPEHIRAHIRKITATSGLPEEEDSVDRIAAGWLEKERAFEAKMAQLSMEDWDEYAKEEERGALIMTYSGSLLTLGPLVEDHRSADYLSIGLRHDVPSSASDPECRLADDIHIDSPVVFAKGPIHQTSSVFKIAVLTGDLEPEEEERRLHEATQVLTGQFVEANKSLTST